MLHLELEDFLVDIDVSVHFGLAHERADRIDVARIPWHEQLPRRNEMAMVEVRADYAVAAAAAIAAPAIRRSLVRKPRASPPRDPRGRSRPRKARGEASRSRTGRLRAA